MKKIRYIPGMISIMLLPLLGMWYMNKHNYFQQLTSLDFVAGGFDEYREWFEEIENSEHNLEYDKENEFDKRDYKEVTLNGYKEKSQKTFQYIDNFVNEVIQTKDTVNGLKIHFGNNAIYNEFIEVLNIFNKRGAQLYLLDNNTMYFVGKDLPSEDIIEIDCEGPPIEYISDEQIAKIKKVFDANNKDSVSQNKYDHLKKQFSQHKTIYSAYLFFVVIVGVSTIRKRNKKHL